ncbi:MAG: DeoR family transcriptional regulator [Bacteroidales bacterium]|nr:DeoR family transcriptional regulator [Bacteroidales bacterium]
MKDNTFQRRREIEYMLLSGKKLTTTELMKIYHVGRKAIRRDFDIIGEELPVVTRQGYDGDKYIVNYLNSVKTVDYIGLPEISTFSTDFKKEFLSFAQEQSHEAELNGNLRVKEKYDWLVQYIQS